MGAKKLLFALLFKVQNSQSVLLFVAHHQQYYKEQQRNIEANFCFLAQSMWLLFYFILWRLSRECFQVIRKVKNCCHFYIVVLMSHV